MKKLILIAASALLAFGIEHRSLAAEEGVVFIVNQANPVTAVTRGQLADYFFKRTRQWPDGSSIRFIDQQDGNAKRRNFIANYLRKSPREIELYWIGQKLYTGSRAPLQVPSDAMTVSMVAAFRGAIGYVASDFKPLKGVKVVPISDQAPE